MNSGKTVFAQLMSFLNWYEFDKCAQRYNGNYNDFNIDLDNMVYALDSTSIELCLNLFPWAKFRKHRRAVKTHTLLDLRGSIPTFIKLTDGLCHDVNVLDELDYEPGAFMSWIVDMSLSNGYFGFIRVEPFSLPEQKEEWILKD